MGDPIKIESSYWSTSATQGERVLGSPDNVGLELLPAKKLHAVATHLLLVTATLHAPFSPSTASRGPPYSLFPPWIRAPCLHLPSPHLQLHLPSSDATKGMTSSAGLLTSSSFGSVRHWAPVPVAAWTIAQRGSDGVAHDCSSGCGANDRGMTPALEATRTTVRRGLDGMARDSSSSGGVDSNRRRERQGRNSSSVSGHDERLV